jgi:hypothetical protein
VNFRENSSLAELPLIAFLRSLLLARKEVSKKDKKIRPSIFIGNSSACALLTAHLRIRALREGQDDGKEQAVSKSRSGKHQSKRCEKGNPAVSWGRNARPQTSMVAG